MLFVGVTQKYTLTQVLKLWTMEPQECLGSGCVFFWKGYCVFKCSLLFQVGGSTLCCTFNPIVVTILAFVFLSSPGLKLAHHHPPIVLHKLLE